MKRGGPLPRRAPLARGDSQLKRVPIKAKRNYSRDRADAEWRIVVLRAAGYRCQAGTPDCTGVATEAHHLAGRVGRLRHDPDNGLAVCSPCHAFITTNRDRQLALDRGWIRRRVT